jgi:protein TonB
VEIKEVIPEPEIVQPEDVPEIVPEVESEGGEMGGVEGGVEGGVAGGVIGGVIGGEIGGVIGGTIGGTGTGPIVPGPGVTLPELVEKVPPDYPEVARHARMSGRVICQAVISKDGDVEEVTVLSASNPLFVEASIAAVQKWKYKPALQNGEPVAVYFTVVVSFELR